MLGGINNALFFQGLAGYVVIALILIPILKWAFPTNKAVKAERAETEPKVFTKINLHFTVKGKNLDLSKVERAVKLSHEKYCSATTMLAKTAEITYSIDVLNDE